MKTTWIQRDKVSALVEVEETQIGQFGGREEAQATAAFHRHEFDGVVVRRDQTYGWLALGQKFGRTIREVA